MKVDDDAPPSFFCDLFDNLKHRSCRRRWELVSACLSAIILGAIVAAILEHGLYPLLDHGPKAATRHLDEWWANPSNGATGFAAFLIIVSLFLFGTVRHTIMGAHILGWLAYARRTSRAAGATEWLGYADPWIAPDEALSELKGAIIDVFIAILLGAAAAGCAVYALEVPPTLVVILVVYLIYNLNIFLIPWIYFNRQLTRSKRRLEERVLGELRTIARSRCEGDRDAEWLWRAHMRVSQFPERIIDRIPVGGLVALYLLPIIGIIPAYR